MQYSFSIVVIDDEQGNFVRDYPALNIGHHEQYGEFFNDEVMHLNNLEYLEEIVEQLSLIRSGKIENYDFGFEVYNIKCSLAEVSVVDIYDGDLEVATIPFTEVYQLMTDWRNWVAKWTRRRHRYNHIKKLKGRLVSIFRLKKLS